MRLQNASVLIFTFALTGCDSYRAENRPPDNLASIRDLAATVAQCVSQPNTDHAVFHGCFDWHSAVHGHWALLRASRVADNPRWAEQVHESMTAEAMAREFKTLAQRPRFEMPYGRSWFLMLMVEYERVFGVAEFSSQADNVAESLDDFLRARTCDLSAVQYDNEAWAYYNLLLYYRWRSDSEREAALTARILTCSSTPQLFARDVTSREFFSAAANQVLLFDLVYDHDTFVNWSVGLDVSGIMPVDGRRSDHQLSINYARAWGLWVIHRRIKSRASRVAYEAHIQAGYDLHPTHKDDYLAYGHWVSQFGILAMSAPEFLD